MRDFKLEQEPKLERSEREPKRLFRERSKVVKKVVHLEPGVKEMVPVRLVYLRARDSRWSRERRKVETRLKLVLREVLLRSMEETKEALQVMPLKVHGFWLGSQLKRTVGSGRLDLKLISCWVSLFDEAWIDRKVREMRRRKKWEFEMGQKVFIFGFVFYAVSGVVVGVLGSQSCH